MAEEATKTIENGENKRVSTGGKQRYADNILPMVISRVFFSALLRFLCFKHFQARIKKIMKMDPNITDNISVEASYVICTATEHFIRWISKQVYEIDTKKTLSYQNLAKYVQDEERLDFLHQVMPNK